MNNPSDILFTAMSAATGGLITDLTTAMLALFAVTLICIAIDYLKDTFEAHMGEVRSRSSLEDARKYKKALLDSKDDVERDFNKARYRNAIRKAAN